MIKMRAEDEKVLEKWGDESYGGKNFGYVKEYFGEVQQGKRIQNPKEIEGPKLEKKVLEETRTIRKRAEDENVLEKWGGRESFGWV